MAVVERDDGACLRRHGVRHTVRQGVRHCVRRTMRHCVRTVRTVRTVRDSAR
jgi:hypothetical protein